MTKSRRVSLTGEELQMLRNALRMGAEDGSLFSDSEADFAIEEPRYQRLCRKLDAALTTEGRK